MFTGFVATVRRPPLLNLPFSIPFSFSKVCMFSARARGTRRQKLQNHSGRRRSEGDETRVPFSASAPQDPFKSWLSASRVDYQQSFRFKQEMLRGISQHYTAQVTISRSDTMRIWCTSTRCPKGCPLRNLSPPYCFQGQRPDYLTVR